MRVEFWADRRGNEPVREYLLALDRQGDDATLSAFERIRDALELQGPAIGMPYSRIIDRRLRIYELRIRQHRIAYAEQDGVWMLLHAWRKQTQKLDEQALATARRRLRDG